MAYLSPNLTSLSEPYRQTLAAITQTLRVAGTPGLQAAQGAIGLIYQQLLSQAQLLAYADVFTACAVASVLVAPIAFFFSAAKAGSGATPLH